MLSELKRKSGIRLAILPLFNISLSLHFISLPRIPLHTSPLCRQREFIFPSLMLSESWKLSKNPEICIFQLPLQNVSYPTYFLFGFASLFFPCGVCETPSSFQLQKESSSFLSELKECKRNPNTRFPQHFPPKRSIVCCIISLAHVYFLFSIIFCSSFNVHNLKVPHSKRLSLKTFVL